MLFLVKLREGFNQILTRSLESGVDSTTAPSDEHYGSSLGNIVALGGAPDVAEDK